MRRTLVTLAMVRGFSVTTGSSEVCSSNEGMETTAKASVHVILNPFKVSWAYILTFTSAAFAYMCKKVEQWVIRALGRHIQDIHFPPLASRTRNVHCVPSIPAPSQTPRSQLPRTFEYQAPVFLLQTKSREK